MYRDSRYRSLLVTTFGGAFLLLPTIVVACAIPPKPTVLEAYDDSDVVIVARAISVERLSDMAPSGTFVSSTTMELKKVFKGNLSVGDKMVFGQGNGIRCRCHSHRALARWKGTYIGEEPFYRFP